MSDFSALREWFSSWPHEGLVGRDETTQTLKCEQDASVCRCVWFLSEFSRSFGSKVDILYRSWRTWLKRVKGSRNVKRLKHSFSFFFKQALLSPGFLGGPTGKQKFVSSFFEMLSFIRFALMVLYEDVCGDDQHLVRRVCLISTNSVFYTMTALPVNQSIWWTCTAHPAATISCCNSWNADFFSFC